MFKLTGSHQIIARRIGRTAGRGLILLGPGYAKVGQIVSTRQDLLPPWLCDGLKDVVVSDSSDVKRGRGSVAIVTATYNRDTRTYQANKRLRPRAHASLHRNLATLRRIMTLAAKLPSLRGIPVMEMTNDISRAVAAQTDLVKEKRSLLRLRSMLDPTSVHVPEVYETSSSEGTIAMEWIDTDPDLSIIGLTSEDRNQVMTILVESLLKMIFVDGFFHCDLHPGNWWPVARNRIAIVDAGFMYELTPVERWHFIEFFYGMAFGDGEHAFRHMLATADASALPPPSQIELLRHEVVTLVEDQHDAPVADFSLATFGSQLFQIQRRHRFRGDTSFIFPLIALLSIEGQLKEFAPELEFQAIARRELGRPLIKLRAQFSRSS